MCLFTPSNDHYTTYLHSTFSIHVFKAFHMLKLNATLKTALSGRNATELGVCLGSPKEFRAEVRFMAHPLSYYIKLLSFSNKLCDYNFNALLT